MMARQGMRILLLSAYDAESHIYWRKGLVSHLDEHQWTVLSLPGRYFNWRIRGNSLSWAFQHRDVLEQPYDLVIATSMTDLSALKGFVPALAHTPVLAYFHENQFAYPESEQQFSSVEPKILNLYTALAADQVVFNTQFNRETFLSGARKLLKKLPDHVPAGLIERIEQRSSVIPVPLADDCFIAGNKDTQKLNITWNHRWEYVPDGHTEKPLFITWAARWEYDKGPDRLLAILRKLEISGVDYRLCILGRDFKNSPEEFRIIQKELEHRIDHAGYAESREEYLGWLSASDIILSTSIHEFQGIAVLEAVDCGCIPVLPNRLSYSEIFSDEYLYEDCGSDIESEALDAVEVIRRHQKLIQGGKQQVPNITKFKWSSMIEAYRELITITPQKN